jgi:hypothetical protein
MATPPQPDSLPKMSTPSSSNNNCKKAKNEAVFGILVPFIAVLFIALLVIATNQ